MQVAEGVFQFKVPRPVDTRIPGGGLRYTLVYAVETPKGWMLIDAGENTDMGFKAFEDQLSQANIAPRDVSDIVITHGHPDHVGLASRIRALTGARLAMHKQDAPDGDLHDRMRTMGDDSRVAHRWMSWHGVPKEEIGKGFVPRRAADSHGHVYHWGSSLPSVDRLLEGGEELVTGSDLWAIWTPGHSPGHVCIHDRKRRLLFSGDHVLPTITPHVSLYPGDEGNPLERFLQSHRDLRELDVAMVHPAHEHSFPDLRGRVDEILDHHRERMDEMGLQVKNGPKTAWEISSRISWNVAPWEELRARTRRMALMETLAHLQHMVVAGELIVQETDSVMLYAEA